MKILVAEDNVTMASALKYLLQKMGFENVSEANDGGDAIRQLSHARFDMVIVDWALPNVSGVAITRWMRTKEPYRKTPIIMVTGKDQAEDVLIAVESGVNEYVLKPLDKNVFRSKVNKVLNRTEPREAA